MMYNENTKTGREYITVTDWIVFFVSTFLIFLSSILLLICGLIVGLFNLFKRKPALALSGVVMVVVLLVVVYWCIAPIPWNIKEDKVHVIVTEGDSMARIVERLRETNLIDDGKIFLALSRLLGKDRHIQAGRYDFERGMSLYSVFNKLVQGKVTPIQVLIPEGSTIKGIARILKEEIGVDSAEFVEAAADSQLIRELNVPARDLEGYLFPDTYKLHWGMDPANLVQAMVNQFKRTFTPLLSERSKEINLSTHEVITLASIVEAEARDGQEREMISAVYHNRLKLGMLLQCDPTVIYALNHEPGLSRPSMSNFDGQSSPRPLLLKDLEIDSPYNTYKYPGLPPGPICNPGKASILAALYPADVDYLYFVATGDGTHIFSSTLDEHNWAKNQIRRTRKGAP
jgi:UPF0755 protein